MRWRLKVDEKIINAELLRVEDGVYKFKINEDLVTLRNPKHRPFSIKTPEVDLSCERWQTGAWRGSTGNFTYNIEPQSFDKRVGGFQNLIRTQMPGRVLKILVEPGQIIQVGQTLLIMEAMKMENEIRADSPARVKSISVKPSQSVESGTVLLELEPV